jgi:hypothetical protein
MTDEQLERRLRDWYRNEIPADETAPPGLRSGVTTVPQTSAASSRPIWRSFNLNRVSLAAGAAAVIVVVIGGVLLLSQRNQPAIGGPVNAPSVAPSPSVEVSPSAPAASAAGIVLQRAPDNLGCDAMDPGYRSVTIHIDPESEVYLEIVNPAWDGTKNSVNVDVWAEVDALPSGSPGTLPVEPLPPGTRLAVYWPAAFTAMGGDTPVIRGSRGEEVARDGTRIDQEFTKRTGYFTCGSRDALFVLENALG